MATLLRTPYEPYISSLNSADKEWPPCIFLLVVIITAGGCGNVALLSRVGVANGCGIAKLLARLLFCRQACLKFESCQH